MLRRVRELFLHVQRWLRERLRPKPPQLRELADPFHAEVLLDGEVVATLSERRPDDMFWRSYRLEPRTAAALDDELWGNCRFTFRSGDQVCTCGFAGGGAPFVRDGRVRLRAMYFGPAPALPRATLR